MREIYRDSIRAEVLTIGTQSSTGTIKLVKDIVDILIGDAEIVDGPVAREYRVRYEVPGSLIIRALSAEEAVKIVEDMIPVIDAHHEGRITVLSGGINFPDVVIMQANEIESDKTVEDYYKSQ